MYRIIIIIITMFCLFQYSAVAADDTETIHDSFGTVILPVEQNPTTKTLEFPAVAKEKGYSICLSFKAYIDWRTAGGWNPYLAIDLNSLNLNKEMANSFPRLLKRGNFLETSNLRFPKVEWWGLRGNKNALLMLFGTGRGALDKTITSPREEGYEYLLDISDAVNYIIYGADFKIDQAKPNKLVLTNLLIEKYVPGYTKRGLIVEDLKVVRIPDTTIDKWRKISLRNFKPDQTAVTMKKHDFTLSVAETGGIIVEFGGENYFFESSFSYPSLPRMQYNLLGVSSGKGQKTWKPSVTSSGNNEILIQAAAEAYTLSRRVKITKSRIEIADTVKNTSSQPIGVRFSNDVGMNGMPASSDFHLGGMQGAEAQDFSFSASNPTIFLRQKYSSVGVVAEDTVYRVQLNLLKRGNSFSMANSNFGLAAGKSYTFEWAIYPQKAIDYYSFINKVRNDWGVNHMIPGPYIGAILSYKNESFLREGQKGEIFSTGPWFEYETGVKYTRNEYKEIMNKEISPVRKKYPNAKFIPKVETNLVTIDITKIPGGDKLPVRKGSRNGPGIQYGMVLNDELTKILDANTSWSDSIIRTNSGNAVVDNFYPFSPLLNLMVQPAIGNYRYQNYMEQIDFLLNDCGYDGIYADQFVPMIVGGITHDKWDGYSVKMDEVGKIIEKYYNYAIAGATARANIARRIIGAGKIFIHNCQPVSRELQGAGAISFQEMENDNVNPIPFMNDKPPAFKWQAACHLASPVILGLRTILYAKGEHKGREAEILTKGIITALRNGVLFYHYVSVIPTSGKNAGGYGPSNYMFPFTPIEINEGFMIGRERILACISKSFNIDSQKRPECLLFDRRGLPKEHVFKVTGEPGNWTVDVKLDDWNEIAVLIR